MTPEDLFDEALSRPPADRPAFLATACSGDEGLRARVEALLRAHENPGSFLAGRPPVSADTIDAPRTEEAGDVIGPYKLLEPIGEGGFGIVFLAEQTEPVRRKVALKVLKPGMDTRQVVARFEAERQALAIMDHPNIAKVFDGGATPSGRPYFVMELVRGVPITEFCDQNQLTPRQRLELFVPVCQAVQHAHQKGIVHRDLKPSNVLVSRHDTALVVKVIDFGVAKALGQELTDKTLTTGTAQMVGTPLYMSPEQAGQGGLDVDTRSDVYSLGVLLYELLTGTTPFTRERFRQAAYDEIRRIIREEEPPRPSTRLTESKDSLPSVSALRHMEPSKLTKLVRGELDWIVMKALEKDRSRRYQSADGFARDLQRYLADEPVQACPPSVGYRLRKFVRRNRESVLAVTAIFLALVGGIIGTTWGMVGAQRARHAEFERAQGERLARQAEAVERARAEREKQIATAVRQFLQHKLLRQADANEQADALLRSGESSGDVRQDPTIRELLDRAAVDLTVDKIEQQFPKQPEVQAEILRTIGDTYRGVGEFEKAIIHLARARDLLRSHLGPDHAVTLATLHQLALACHHAGRLSEAIRLYEQVRDFRTATLGPDHRDTLAALNNLASAYRDAGRVLEAMKLFEELRDKWIATLGPDHRSSLIALSNLADARKDAGRLTEAIELFEQVKSTWIATLGPDHPATLTVLNKLATAYMSAGRLKEAIELLERVRAKRMDQLGPCHQDTLVTQNNLAVAYSQAGRSLEAIRLCEKARDDSVAKLGAEHPDTLTAVYNLAVEYKRAGRLSETIQLFEQVRDKWIATRGPDHPGTLSALNGLAAAYESAGKPIEAIKLHEQVRDRQTRSVGPDHPATLTTLNNLAVAYLSGGRPNEAIKLFEQVRDQWIVTLGPDHRSTLATLSNLARAYAAIGKLDLALPLHERTLEKRKINLGPDHPDTFTSMNNLAAAYWVARKLDRSIPLFEATFQRRLTKLGEDHPDTLVTMANLGVNYRDAGRLQDAIPLLQEAHERCQRFRECPPALLLFVPEALAQTYERAGMRAKAEIIYRQDLEYTTKRFGADDAATASAQARLGVYLFRQRKFTEAEPILANCLAIRQATEPNDWKTFDTQSILGGCLLGQRKYADAEPHLVAAYQGIKACRATADNGLSARAFEALDRLVQLYVSWGKADEAAKWQVELDALAKATGIKHPELKRKAR